MAWETVNPWQSHPPKLQKSLCGSLRFAYHRLHVAYVTRKLIAMNSWTSGVSSHKWHNQLALPHPPNNWQSACTADHPSSVPHHASSLATSSVLTLTSLLTSSQNFNVSLNFESALGFKQPQNYPSPNEPELQLCPTKDPINAQIVDIRWWIDTRFLRQCWDSSKTTCEGRLWGV